MGLDSLPYVDREYEEMKDQVDALVASEKRSLNLPPESQEILARFPSASTFFTQSPLLSLDMERVASGKPLSPLPEFSLDNIVDSQKPKSVEAVSRASESVCLQFEYLKNSLVNMELLSKFGSNAWLLQNHASERLVRDYEKAAEANVQAIAGVNRKRKLAQIEAGRELMALEERWIGLVNSKLQVELANEELEKKQRK
eukprot:Partr_v1_DN27462_c1_g1_i1_m72076 putative Breast carcinoma amplified sequence 2